MATNRTDEKKLNLRVNTIKSAIKELAEESKEFDVCDHNNLTQSFEIKKHFIENDGRHLTVEGVKMLASNMRRSIDNVLNIPYTPYTPSRRPLNSNSNPNNQRWQRRGKRKGY